MNIEETLDYINKAGAILAAAAAITPTIIKLGSDVKAALDGKEITDDMWTTLRAQEDANTAILDAPMEGE